MKQAKKPKKLIKKYGTYIYITHYQVQYTTDNDNKKCEKCERCERCS